jgi:glycerol-3-phosphate dehydrogenase (NAD(P)+)
MKVGIIGAGAWGSALGLASHNCDNDVTLWSYDGMAAEFDGISLPDDIKITGNLADLTPMDIWLIVTPAAYFRETIVRARKFYNNQPIIICTKGIEPITHNFMSEILAAELHAATEYGVLSGPQFAGEVARGVKTGSTLAGTKIALKMGETAICKLELQKTDDIPGAEVCGVGKNAVALISGYCSIAAAGENERALIFTRAWGDVVRFGMAIGAKMETFLELCGIGDLFLSATSKTSRNYSAGVALANGTEITGTVEGISALCGLIKRASDIKVAVPTLTDLCDKMKLNTAPDTI